MSAALKSPAEASPIIEEKWRLGKAEAPLVNSLFLIILLLSYDHSRYMHLRGVPSTLLLSNVSECH